MEIYNFKKHEGSNTEEVDNQLSDSSLQDSITFQIASDLHPEYIHINEEINPFETFLTPCADILILAGDCGNLHLPEQLENFLFEICKKYKYVIYVPGNHEFYHVKDVTGIPMEDLQERLINIVNSINSRFEGDTKRLILLQRSSICIGNLIITGCTLWSRAIIDEGIFPSFIIKITWDIDPITGRHRSITQEQYNSLHAQDLEHVENMIEYAKEQNKKLMIITHHLPTGRPFSDIELERKYISLYKTDLDHLLNESNMGYWICGHIHKTFDINIEGMRLISNQYGKPRGPNSDFEKDFSIEVNI